MKKFIFTILVITAINIFAPGAHAQMMWGGWSSPFGSNQTNSFMMGGNNLIGWGGFGGIFMILWWVLIIAGIIALVRWLMTTSHGTLGNGKSALDILKERYARGEIDKKEFEERKKDLGF